jgi:hypothetical protein
VYTCSFVFPSQSNSSLCNVHMICVCKGGIEIGRQLGLKDKGKNDN